MLTDPRAIEIISRAQQKNVRNPMRNRIPFETIINDFFSEVDFCGQKVIDLGPGQFDFATLVAASGALTKGLDKDPAVLDLGKYLGFDVEQVDLQSAQQLSRLATNQCDGLFCKFSFNAFWSNTAQKSTDMLENQYLKILRPAGWAWLAPWNGISGNDITDIPGESQVLDLQKEVFRDAGFSCFELPEDLSIRYGVHGRVQNNPLFVRGLGIPAELQQFRKF